ncbi:hypothetical protein BKA62DRAFT_251148 [Auriculariales sp. MPI-PUGE-AT-0066]|nr:hypothetical protein BKA62DRAFT_251148 [Auriculariales sp. MPI-PUGE-AT-0066]
MSVASTPRWRRVAQDALVCVLVLLLVVLVTTNHEAEPVFAPRPATHRYVKRDGGATAAGIVVGALIFFGFVGFAWISCQHPHWNLCRCCCKCCDNTKDADMGGRGARGSWFRAEDKAQTDLEMAQVETVMSRFEEEAAEKALAHRRGASYETREMRVPPREGERVGRSSQDRIRTTPSGEPTQR